MKIISIYEQQESEMVYVVDVNVRYVYRIDPNTYAGCAPGELLDIEIDEVHRPENGNNMSFEARIEDEVEFADTEQIGWVELVDHPMIYTLLVMKSFLCDDEKNILTVHILYTSVCREQKYVDKAVRWVQRVYNKPKYTEQVFRLADQKIAELLDDYDPGMRGL